MRRYEGFSPVRSSGRSLLPPGGYVIKIMKAEEMSFSGRATLMVSFDIDEGVHAGFYAADYRNNTYANKFWRGVHYLNIPKGDGSEQDGWAVNAMNNFIAVLQESNPGYAWSWEAAERGDYTALKGKRLGALMGRVEWAKNGKSGWDTKCRAIIPVDDIRAGDFQVPEDKLIKKNLFEASRPASASGNEQQSLPDVAWSDSDDDLPF